MPTRRKIPLSKKLEAVLLMCGFKEHDLDRIEWDHCPPLAMRLVDPETGEWVPHQHDPRHLVPLLREDHARKTHGPDGDRRKINKAKRIAEDYAGLRMRMTVVEDADEIPPKRKKRRLPGGRDSELKKPLRGKAVRRTE